MNKLFKISIIASLALATSAFLSYSKAVNVSDSFISPIKSKLFEEGITFKPYFYFSQSDPLEYYVASWIVRYSPRQGFAGSPIEIYVSILGNIKLTQPRDLKKRIEQMVKEKEEVR